MPAGNQNVIQQLVRRSKLFVPVNREKFVAKAWTRNADCIILDLEDSIAPADKASARKMIKDVIPIVAKGGAEIEVRINRDFEAEDLEAIIGPALTSVLIPKCESAAEIQNLDRMVGQLEKERGLAIGKIQFALIVETARGVVNMEAIVAASPRVVQASAGTVDLARDMGFTRSPELNFEQLYYVKSKLLYAARAAGVQPVGLMPRGSADFTDVAAAPEAMRQVCRESFMMGFLASTMIHPAWCGPINEEFKPPAAEIAKARRWKAALEEAYARGQGSVAVDGTMIDVANMKHAENVLERAAAVARREAEKAAAFAAARGA
jgi:citrate lyase subunit beta / citryl-CoA lyase